MKIGKVEQSITKMGQKLTRIFNNEEKLLQQRILKPNGNLTIVDFTEDGTTAVRKFSNNNNLNEKYDILVAKDDNGSYKRVKNNYDIRYRSYADKAMQNNPFVVKSTIATSFDKNGVMRSVESMINEGTPVYTTQYGHKMAVHPQTSFTTETFDANGKLIIRSGLQYENGVWDTICSSNNCPKTHKLYEHKSSLIDNEAATLGAHSVI